MVLVLLLELYDRLRGAWGALLDRWDRQRQPVLDEAPQRPRRRAF